MRLTDDTRDGGGEAMDVRRLGRTGYEVGSIGLGAWAMGGDWGSVDDAESLRTLHAAADAGVTLFDTADVYGDGRSERLIGRFLRERPGERLVVATKMGRRVPQLVEHYTPESFRGWLARSRENLGVERIDLVQLHCPPTELYERAEVFAALDELVAEGLVAYHGVSVERIDEGLKALEHPGVSSVQIIFNIVRQRPAERFLAEARRRDVGVLARVPLASGLLTGKLSADTAFEATDHRAYNRHGEAFDVGETFAGLDYETGLALVEQLRPLVPEGATMAQLALRWILMHEGVTCAIPGAKTPQQARANAAAADLPALGEATMARIRELYLEHAAPLVGSRW
jgi:aryl-alcohol dehydrogenase-like predicted oxidoreductase